MNEVKVSIIVPVYNTEKYLRQCLDSILAQTLREIEVICVNDGSTDSSGAILEEYQEKDARITAVHLAKGSIGTARNHGIDLAIGAYVGFVDSDDFVDRNMFQFLYEKAIACKSQVTVTNINLYYNETGSTALYRDFDLYSRLESFESFTAQEHPEILQSIGIWDKLYERDFLVNHHLYNPENIIFEDHLFSFQALILAPKIAVVNLPLYYYRKNLSYSITGTEIRNDSYKMDFLQICSRIKDFLYETETYELFSNEFVKYQFTNSLWHQSNIVTYKSFSCFFYTLRKMSCSGELQIAGKLPDAKVKIYIFALQHRLCFAFYLVCRIKNAIKKYTR